MSDPNTQLDSDEGKTPSENFDDTEYRVLARKYRPNTFSELIGQEVLVQTLSNAFKLQRLAHAFILSGVRGVGKTTTARIIARALNCTTMNNDGNVTSDPCGRCENCSAIAEDRHVDVLEMDAASRTGVDDIRDLIEGVRYRPTVARFKVYIIDEVHMLSRNAFNALLKTLEEPPEHVKFIFATTEIQKVPVTVISRCQRFDLARVDIETLMAHFAWVAKTEKAEITKPALHLIARAADGSVRDGLSLLDQSISQANGEITDDVIRGMLGLADRTNTFDLLQAVLAGKIANALEQFDQYYRDGAEPLAVLEDMLDIVHWVTRIKIVPSVAEGLDVPEAERVRGKNMEASLQMPVLARAWQMLLKGLQEVRFAPSQRQAAEMLLVRLAYTSNLPTPEEAVKLIDAKDNSSVDPAESSAALPSSESASNHAGVAGVIAAETAVTDTAPKPDAHVLEEKSATKTSCQKFSDIIALASLKRELILKANLENDVHVVSFEPGRLEFRAAETAPSDLASQLTKFLNEHTDCRWVVALSDNAGDLSIAERRIDDQHRLEAEAVQHPLVKSVMDAFPGAKLADVNMISNGGMINEE